jgi:hypothetical protein
MLAKPSSRFIQAHSDTSEEGKLFAPSFHTTMKNDETQCSKTGSPSLGNCRRVSHRFPLLESKWPFIDISWLECVSMNLSLSSCTLSLSFRHVCPEPVLVK